MEHSRSTEVWWEVPSGGLVSEPLAAGGSGRPQRIDAFQLQAPVNGCLDISGHFHLVFNTWKTAGCHVTVQC